MVVVVDVSAPVAARVLVDVDPPADVAGVTTPATTVLVSTAGTGVLDVQVVVEFCPGTAMTSLVGAIPTVAPTVDGAVTVAVSDGTWWYTFGPSGSLEAATTSGFLAVDVATVLGDPPVTPSSAE